VFRTVHLYLREGCEVRRDIRICICLFIEQYYWTNVTEPIENEEMYLERFNPLMPSSTIDLFLLLHLVSLNNNVNIIFEMTCNNWILFTSREDMKACKCLGGRAS
jgi:hypothetical protein